MEHSMTKGLLISFAVLSMVILSVAWVLGSETEARPFGLSESVITVKPSISATECPDEDVAIKEDSKVDISEAETAMTVSASKGKSSEMKKNKAVDNDFGNADVLAQADDTSSNKTPTTEVLTTQETEYNPTTENITRDDTTENTSEKEPTTESMPATTESNTEQGTEAATEATTERERIWHPEVTEQVWVVDKPAWTEEYTYKEIVRYADFCYCGYELKNAADFEAHYEGNYVCSGWRGDVPVYETKTGYIEHPEEGHYETRVIKEGYWE